MDPVELFKLSTSNQYEFHELKGEWFYQAKHNSSSPFQAFNRDRQFLRIKGCIEARKTQNGLFSCQCGVCQAYLIHKLYEAVVMEKKTESTTTTESSVTPPNSPQFSTGSRMLGFGKYSGQTFEHVYATDRKYCIWCIEKAAQDKMTGGISDMFQEFVSYVKGRFMEK
jgi:hypothetical protein